MTEKTPENTPDKVDPFEFMAAKDEDLAELQDVERPVADEGNPELKEQVLAALKTVRDPEIPVNLVDLGLIYELMVNKDGTVYVEMTLTTPACPVAGALPGQVRDAISAVPGVQEARVKLVWTPPWDKARMSEEAKLELGLMD